MERQILFEAAYDKRDPDPAKNCGIQGVNLRFLLKGDKGAVQFLLHTNWMLPHVQEGLDLRHPDHLLCHPQPADLGYHSLSPLHDYQEEPSQEHCPFLDGAPCYYDGSSLNAQPVFERLLREGDDGVWAELEDYYKQLFGEDG